MTVEAHTASLPASHEETVTIALPFGDPRGIGAEVALKAIASRRRTIRILLVGSATAIDRAWASIGGEPPPDLLDVADPLEALDRAIGLALHRDVQAVVTGPVSKEAVFATGVPFVGQTERCAERAGLAPDDVTMMFLGPRLRIAVVTRHLAVADVPAAVTQSRVERATAHLIEALRRLGTPHPRVVVTGLNPHAGEHGLFGDEEARSIAPAVESVRARDPDVDLTGPIPAEAAFRRAVDGRWDGVVAMFHDQATIASKLVDWGEAVNVTWGLPFVRTSVDHGVALDIAGQGIADARGMGAAIDLAVRLVVTR